MWWDAITSWQQAYSGDKVEARHWVLHYALPHCAIRKGQYFKVTVLDDNGKIISPGQLKRVFQGIVETVGGSCIKGYW